MVFYCMELYQLCLCFCIGYGNEAKVYLDDLLPSLGKQEIELQKRCAKEEKVNATVTCITDGKCNYF